MTNFQNTSTATMTSQKSFLNDKIAKKIFKNEKYGKKLSIIYKQKKDKSPFFHILNYQPF